MRTYLSVLFFVGVALSSFASPAAAVEFNRIDFNRDVRPILAKHCFTCHGPDEDARESGLRLDDESASRADLGGYAAIAPGDAAASELFVRIASDDADLRMPPSDSHPALSSQDIETLRTWIEMGANYEQHWAFVPPTAATPPPIADTASPIDAFVRAKQTEQGQTPRPPADDAAWLRRVTLDLTGTMPTVSETDRFLSDEHPLARRRVVDRLLTSPDFGEKFTRPWLDLARYADTNGYEKDRERTIWPYRNWVLDAINDDMPFDQFSIEQLAGDMLPNATADQRIATGFHRNTMLNEEGGIDPLEYRWLAVVDRVATTGTTWLGLTTGCAQCHTHKYDPITHTDYYRWFGLLNQADEPELQLDAPEHSKELESAYHLLVQEHLDKDDALREAFNLFVREESAAARQWRRLSPISLQSTTPKLTRLDDDSILASGDVSKRDTYKVRFRLPSGNQVLALQLHVLPHESLPAGGPGMTYYEGRRGDFFLSELIVRVDGKAVPLVDASHSFGQLSVGSGSAVAANVLDGDGSTGWSTSTSAGEANRLVVNFETPVNAGSDLEVEMLFERHFAAALGHFAVSVTSDSVTSEQVTSEQVTSEQVTSEQAPAVASRLPDLLIQQLAGGLESDEPPLDVKRWFVRYADEFADLRKSIEQQFDVERERTYTLVMKQREREDWRTTRRHNRGEYLQAAEEVTPENLALFGSLSPGHDNDRLGLARFLVSRDNPLVGRVQMNRMWRHFFGAGIVDTAGDFGTQSQPPTHPELLDWLAVDWMDGGWSNKRMIRKLVLSATYGQAIGRPPEDDPNNRWLSVFPYRRMDAESIRDSMLSASGLLQRTWGGPSVRPPQPESVSQLAYGTPSWQASTGADRYRRSVYTFSRRTAPFAAFTTFDGPSGELCVARRDSSTNPLQALTLLNDAMFVEFARGLADDVLRQHPDTTDRVVAEHMFRRVLTRRPDDVELDSILRFFNDTHDWTLVARAILNTDEAITLP